MSWRSAELHAWRSPVNERWISAAISIEHARWYEQTRAMTVRRSRAPRPSGPTRCRTSRGLRDAAGSRADRSLACRFSHGASFCSTFAVRTARAGPRVALASSVGRSCRFSYLLLSVAVASGAVVKPDPRLAGRLLLRDLAGRGDRRPIPSGQRGCRDAVQDHGEQDGPGDGLQEH